MLCVEDLRTMMDTPLRSTTCPEDIQWWEIERRTTRGGRTTYGIRVEGERVARGKRSVFAAINEALAVLYQREQAEGLSLASEVTR